MYRITTNKPFKHSLIPIKYEFCHMRDLNGGVPKERGKIYVELIKGNLFSKGVLNYKLLINTGDDIDGKPPTELTVIEHSIKLDNKVKFRIPEELDLTDINFRKRLIKFAYWRGDLDMISLQKEINKELVARLKGVNKSSSFDNIHYEIPDLLWMEKVYRLDLLTTLKPGELLEQNKIYLQLENGIIKYKALIDNQVTRGKISRNDLGIDIDSFPTEDNLQQFKAIEKEILAIAPRRAIVIIDDRNKYIEKQQSTNQIGYDVTPIVSPENNKPNNEDSLPKP